MRRFAAAASMAMMAAACVPAPRPLPSTAAVAPPAGWVEQAESPGPLQADWWTRFGDPVLDRLEARAAALNTDVLAAAARVDEARADIALARAALRPSIGAGLNAGRSRALGALGVATGNAIEAEVTAGWETDLFGRLRAQQKAARYRFVASRGDRDAVGLSVAGQIARGYFALVSLDAQLIVTQETLGTRHIALTLAQDQARVGYISEFEVTQAESEYQAVQSRIPELRRAIRNAENALTLLTGSPPGVPFARGRLINLKPPTVPGVFPSDLLRRRPDIVSWEARLLASDASLTASRRAFLPTVSLSSSAGELLVNGLNYNPLTVWSIGGSILAPIFEGGRLRANVDVATAQRDQAAFAYRGAVLAAFAEVENALTNVRQYMESARIYEKRIAVLRRSVELATDRYVGGYASYLDQLDAQRNLYATELEAIAAYQSQLDSAVQLTLAFGGGWVPSADQLP